MYQTTQAKSSYTAPPLSLGESKADKFVNAFIISLIVLNVIAVMLETVEPLQAKYERFFDYFDQVSVFIFTVEYVLRSLELHTRPTI